MAPQREMSTTRSPPGLRPASPSSPPPRRSPPSCAPRQTPIWRCWSSPDGSSGRRWGKAKTTASYDGGARSALGNRGGVAMADKDGSNGGQNASPAKSLNEQNWPGLLAITALNLVVFAVVLGTDPAPFSKLTT